MKVFKDFFNLLLSKLNTQIGYVDVTKNDETQIK
jgi:hypothetical protein